MDQIDMIQLEPAKLLRLLQLVDSSFPTGDYSFSNGMEGVALDGLLQSETAVQELIRTQIDEGLAGVELPALIAAHHAAETGDLDRLHILDELLTAMKPVPAFRAASIKVGRRFLESASLLVDSHVATAYLDAIRRGERAGHYAIAFGIVFHAAGIDEEGTALAFASGFLQGQTAAALRLGLIGQNGAQRLIAALQPALIDAVASAPFRPMSEWGAYQPMLDLAGLQQPDLVGRLFAS